MSRRLEQEDQKSGSSGWAYCERSWAKAQKSYERDKRSAGLSGKIVQLRRHTDASPTWRKRFGRKAASRRKTMLGMLTLAERLGGFRFYADLRSVSEASGVCLRTVDQALSDLEDLGLVAVVAAGGGQLATEWKIDAKVVVANLHHSSHRGLVLELEKEQIEEVYGGGEVRRAGDHLHDAWWHGGGLGDDGRRIWKFLSRCPGATPKEISAGLSLHRGSVWRTIRALVAVDLVTRAAHGGYTARERDLAVVAAEVGTAGRGAAQRLRYDLQRQGWKAHLERQAERSKRRPVIYLDEEGRRRARLCVRYRDMALASGMKRGPPLAMAV